MERGPIKIFSHSSIFRSNLKLLLHENKCSPKSCDQRRHLECSKCGLNLFHSIAESKIDYRQFQYNESKEEYAEELYFNKD